MSFGKYLTLRTGAKIPQIGLGTWLSKHHEIETAVEVAIRNGYRHLDLAFVYENQPGVSAALKKVIPSVVQREDLFITSKLWNTSHQPSEVEKELDETLRQLGVDYLDLYLIHWPTPFVPGSGLWPIDPERPGEIAIDTGANLVDTWKAMIALPKSKVKAIGVSNFTVEKIEGIISATGVVPAVNQIEAHPLLHQDELREYCESRNILITAYSPLGNNLFGKPSLIESDPVVEVANKIGATPAQVLIAWAAYRGYAVIPKSVKEDRIVCNFKQVELSKEEYEKVSALGRRERFSYPIKFNVKWGIPQWNIDLFNEEEEKDARYKVKIYGH